MQRSYVFLCYVPAPFIFLHFLLKTLTHINIHTTHNRNKIYYRKYDKLPCAADKLPCKNDNTYFFAPNKQPCERKKWR